MNESSHVRNKITSISDNPRWSQLHPSDLDFVQQDQVTVTFPKLMIILVVRSRNTRDPVPVSSSLPGGLVTMEELFQLVISCSINSQNIFRCSGGEQSASLIYICVI